LRRADFFVVEAIRALRNNLATTVAATVTVLIVLYFLGVFVLFGTYLYAKVDKERSGVRVTVYLDKRASSQQIKNIGARLRQNPDVKPNAVSYVSKAEAWKRLKTRVPKTVWESVLTNPLPASWEASLANPGRAKDVAASVRGMAGVEKGSNGVKYGGAEADRLLRNAAVVEAVIGGLILILAISAVALIANTIRLSIFARRREVEVMKLVGATDWFIRWPFVIEGTVVGAAGAVLAIVILGITKVALLDPLASSWTLIAAPQTIPFWALLALLLGAGVMVSAIGSGLSLRRFLRV
jgi:cell division transport system permease protein